VDDQVKAAGAAPPTDPAAEPTPFRPV